MNVVREVAHGRVGGEDQLPRQQPKGHTTHRVDVQPPIDVGPAQRLLRGDEGRCTLNCVFSGEGRGGTNPFWRYHCHIMEKEI